MIAASLIGVFCGSCLGLRFKAAMLVPAILVAALVVGCAVAVGSLTAMQAGADLVALSLGLELAYVAAVSITTE